MEGFWAEIARAFCLLLVIEGVIPFLYPGRWRALLEQVSATDNNALRTVGFVSMLLGVGGLYLL